MLKRKETYLWIAWPAFTLAVNACTIYCQDTEAQRQVKRHTALKSACLGGHVQGTLIGRPLAPFTAPSQSPVPTMTDRQHTGRQDEQMLAHR